MKTPVYPILTIENEENRIYSFRNEKDFSIADEELVEKLGFSSLRVIDANGVEFKINSYKKIGWGTIFGGYSLLSKGRQIKLEFDFDIVGEYDLTDLKKIIVEIVNNGKERVELPEGNKGLIHAIENAKNIKDLISLFY